MPKQTAIILGPVLSFRGSTQSEWKITALIGVPAGDEAPAMQVDGRACRKPLMLLRHAGNCYYRYDFTCPLEAAERRVKYGIASNNMEWQFTIPGCNFAPRMAYVSCNGFSDPVGIRKLVRPANAVWEDLLANHDRSLRSPKYLLDKEQLWHEERIHDKKLQRFHLLLMGGDQIYFDSIWEEIEELRHWVSLSRPEQLEFSVSADLRKKIEDYYLSLYPRRWLPSTRQPWTSKALGQDAADAMARIPTVMMWDDHDIFDGWGSYTCEMQQCAVFQTLFACARKAFWIFQLQHAPKALPELSPINRKNVSLRDPQFEPIAWQIQLDKDPLALPLLTDQPGFSFGFHVGPVSLLVADLRTERSRTQIMGPAAWSGVQAWLNALPKDGERANPGTRCQHLLVLSSVPVAHPKLSLAESFLDSFGEDHVTDSNADDLRDHWSHDDHEGERKRLLSTLSTIAESLQLRVSILSGDVHVAAWGTIYRKDPLPAQNGAQIHQFTSSAVVHPSLTGVLEKMFLVFLNQAASKPQALDVQHTVEMLLFPGHNRYVMPARNWLAIELDIAKGTPAGSKLWATWRCETKGDNFSNHLQAVSPNVLL